jgi:hypothetical protein
MRGEFDEAVIQHSQAVQLVAEEECAAHGHQTEPDAPADTDRHEKQEGDGNRRSFGAIRHAWILVQLKSQNASFVARSRKPEAREKTRDSSQ